MMVREAYNGMSALRFESRYGHPDVITHRQIRSGQRAIAEGVGITAGILVGIVARHPWAAIAVDRFVTNRVDRAFRIMNHAFRW